MIFYLNTLLKLWLILFFFYSEDLNANVSRNISPLRNAQIMVSESMRVNDLRMRVAAENMANSKSANYIPKSIEIGVRQIPGQSFKTVYVKQIKSEKNKIKKVYDPTHPQADAEGMVTYPDVDPLMMLMDLNQAKIDNEHAMKFYRAFIDQRQRSISLLNG